MRLDARITLVPSIPSGDLVVGIYCHRNGDQHAQGKFNMPK
jgi:hypothetical protein